jgi:hypothetical protein
MPAPTTQALLRCLSGHRRMRPKIRVLAVVGKLLESDSAEWPAIGQCAVESRAQGIEFF